MKVFKFGGASVKSAESIKNLVSILKKEDVKLIVVVSAMNKITNLLEEICSAYFTQSETMHSLVDQLVSFHTEILQSLFPDKENPAFQIFNNQIQKLKTYLTREPSMDFDFEYDQVVSFGELISTHIISAYLTLKGISNEWIDIRKCLKTDSQFRDAKIDWQLSGKLTNEGFDFSRSDIFVTQGFIGSTKNNLTTTLGREGSDYTAAILTYLLDADEIVIWKDVAGIFNADPHQFNKVEKLDKISFQEAIELAYYGAKVIHPKTIKPLQNKQIPLKVKSFENPIADGTLISTFAERVDFPPVYIIKEKQVLISISPKDFSFIAEENLSKLFAIFAQQRVKVNLSENSAISFSACVDFDERKFPDLISALRKDFKVLYNSGLRLITIRHYTKEAIAHLVKSRKVFVEQKNRLTARFVVGNEID